MPDFFLDQKNHFSGQGKNLGLGFSLLFFVLILFQQFFGCILSKYSQKTVQKRIGTIIFQILAVQKPPEQYGKSTLIVCFVTVYIYHCTVTVVPTTKKLCFALAISYQSVKFVLALSTKSVNLRNIVVLMAVLVCTQVLLSPIWSGGQAKWDLTEPRSKLKLPSKQ